MDLNSVVLEGTLMAKPAVYQSPSGRKVMRLVTVVRTGDPTRTEVIVVTFDADDTTMEHFTVIAHTTRGTRVLVAGSMHRDEVAAATVIVMMPLSTPGDPS